MVRLPHRCVRSRYSGRTVTDKARNVIGRRWLTGAAAAAAFPVVRAGASGARFTVQAALAERRGVQVNDDVPNPAPSLQLAASVALDEFFLQSGAIIASTTPAHHYERSSRELDDAVRFYDRQGWLDDPADYFTAPPPARDVRFTRVQRRKGPLEVLRFESQWNSHPNEPGGERWHAFDTNREVVAAVLRHDEGPRPWLVCLHGQNMGRFGDIDSLGVRRLHDELGINLVLPVLPLHGPRRPGLRMDQQFVSNVYPVNNVLGMAQSIWDLRRIVAWLRDEQSASTVGLFGLSLGSYVASLLTTLDGDFACVIAVVPNGDLATALRVVEPVSPKRRRAHHGIHDWRSTMVHRVVSPLVSPCRVPKERRFVVAGQGDRIATPHGAVMLWRHWEQPAIDWRPGGHLTTPRSTAYHDRITGILRSSGLAMN